LVQVDHVPDERSFRSKWARALSKSTYDIRSGLKPGSVTLRPIGDLPVAARRALPIIVQGAACAVQAAPFRTVLVSSDR
jgi:hypothetical protein